MAATHYEQIMQFVADRIQRGSWLDVGGGIGAFLNRVRSAHPSFSVHLNEMNPASAGFAHEFYGIDVVSQDAEALAKLPERYDVVSMLAVLEHVPHPRGFVSSYAKLVAPGGLFIINVPRWSRLNQLISRGASANVVPPSHVSLFGTRNLLRMLRGLEGLRIAEYWINGPNAFSLSHAMHNGEYVDVEIPFSDQQNLKTVQTRMLSQRQARLVTRLSKWDKRLMQLIRFLDGGIYMNVALERAGGDL